MTFLSKWQPHILGLLRIVTGLLFLEHGTSKLFHWPPVDMPAPPPGFMPVLIAAGTIELIGGALVTVGLMTRLAAFIVSGEMAIGYWMVHFAKGMQHGAYFPVQNLGDAAILFCFVFLYIASAGPGSWSIDKK
ncbi:MAG: DoxX family protein [Proteobacteria bacterium]|nr:DoxX family protein [Pseudomonadota bacterium]